MNRATIIVKQEIGRGQWRAPFAALRSFPIRSFRVPCSVHTGMQEDESETADVSRILSTARRCRLRKLPVIWVETGSQLTATCTTLFTSKIRNFLLEER